MTAINATGGGTLHNVEVNDEEASQTCLYCANLKVLRDLLPPKRCDYCRKWRCQFCTLKFPLLGARKGLPKKLKGVWVGQQSTCQWRTLWDVGVSCAASALWRETQ
ncbi:hypothetical protein PInf_024463 [Phytophthora infestans]|nr:hypothetical protein PInf_024463 [Phytophthora infestans]